MRVVVSLRQKEIKSQCAKGVVREVASLRCDGGGGEAGAPHHEPKLVLARASSGLNSR